MGRGWQPSMKKTAGSDILHKPGDASGMMEVTSRDIKRVREEGKRWRRGVVVVDNGAFVSRFPC